jgi:PKD repeat protein
MKKQNLNIEDLFRQSFDGYKIEPSPNLWSKLNTRLSLKQFFKADFKTFNIYYSSLFIGLIATLVVVFTKPANNNETISSNTIITSSNNKNIVKLNEIENSEQQTLNITNSKTISGQKKTVNNSNYVSVPIEYITENKNIITDWDEIKKIDPVILNAIDTSKDLNSIIPVKPRPLFSISSKEGCAPFELKPNNLTEGATNYYWTFGDGGKSQDRSPVYTYNYPGVYRIQLKAIGPGGTALSMIDSIVIHDKSPVKSNWLYNSEVYSGEKLYVPIETQKLKQFECNFGDGTIIHNKPCQHIYQLKGQYSITLKTWDENGCYDSIKIADVKVIQNKNRIIFPNAFSPNLDGPSSGRYSDRESRVDIFHPIFNAPIAEYKLVVYSKTGAIVFQSTDIKIGWDGYYEQKLMPEGVYPFIAIVKFEGNSPIIIKENCTLIYRK